MSRRRARHQRRLHAADPFDGMARDSNGCPTERVVIDGQEVVVHYDDVPATDLTTVDGIPCTTALRTVIDIAPDIGEAELALIVRDCLARGLFTMDEARTRLGQPDMRTRPGAVKLRRHLFG